MDRCVFCGRPHPNVNPRFRYGDYCPDEEILCESCASEVGRGWGGFNWLTLLAVAFVNRALDDGTTHDMGRALTEGDHETYRRQRHSMKPEYREILRGAIKGTPLEKELVEEFLQQPASTAAGPMCHVCGVAPATVSPGKEWDRNELPMTDALCAPCGKDTGSTHYRLDWASKVVAMRLAQKLGMNLNDSRNNCGLVFFQPTEPSPHRQRGVLLPKYHDVLRGLIEGKPLEAEMRSFLKEPPREQPKTPAKPEPTADELADKQLAEAKKKRETKEAAWDSHMVEERAAASLQNGYDITHRAKEELDRPMRPRYPRVAPLMTCDGGNPWNR